MVSVLIAGASGTIGTALQAVLRENGHHVHTLVRRKPHGPTEHQWSPDNHQIDSGIINHVDAVVNLSGASISRMPWSARHKELILSSRVNATKTLAQAIKKSPTPPQVLLQGSAVGFYGDRGEESLDEKSKRGSGYLADVVVAWEKAATPTTLKQTRVIYARTGLVVGHAGAMAPLRLQTLVGLGGKVGPGTQWWPWISLHDEVRALVHLITHHSAEGVFNLVGPTPATASKLTQELAQAMKRPHLIGLPSFAIRALLGEAGVALLLTSQHIAPSRLHESGFSFSEPTVHDAIARMLRN